MILFFEVIHIFGDTTLEFPETYEYIKRFKKNHRFTPMLNAKNKEKNFYDLCDLGLSDSLSYLLLLNDSERLIP